MICASALSGFPTAEFPKIVLALGAFDGIHIGHRQILQKVLRKARGIRGTATVLTFQEHPQKVLHPAEKTSILTSFWHKMSLIAELGVDLCVALHFNRAFSKLSPEEFVRRLLVMKLQVHSVILGHDSRFGHNRAGDAQAMRDLARRYGFEFEVVAPLKKGSSTVSSTLIRRLIGEGRIVRARELLGRGYSILATVVKGAGRGKTLGFPTANLDPHSEVLPPSGVYAVRVRRVRIFLERGRKFFHRFHCQHDTPLLPAVLNLGTRPTFNGSARQLVAEVHLLNFRGNLYGKTIEVEFIKRLRDEMKFSSGDALRRQIQRDVRLARSYVH